MVRRSAVQKCVGVVTLGLALGAAWGAEPPAVTNTWAQWGGPERDGKSRETGLLQRWPAEGPRLVWAASGLGKGWSPPSITGDGVYVTGVVGSNEVVFALDPAGKLRWKTPYGAAWTRSHAGARCQPTVLGGRVYVISALVRVACLDAADGRVVWSVDAMERFHGTSRSYGNAESPLIVDDKVIVSPGGANASLAALNVADGATVWTTKDLSQPAAYCSPILVQRGGLKIVTTLVKEGVVGVGASDGAVLWFGAHRNKYDNHPSSPAYEGGCLVVASGYGAGAKMFRLSEDGRTLTKLWESRKPDTMHGGIVFLAGHVYGASNAKQNSGGEWVCLEAATGKTVYEKRWVKAGSATYADGHLYCYGEDGRVALVPAGPDAAAADGEFAVTQGSGEHYTHPVVCGGRLYIRHGDVLLAYDVALRAYARLKF
jgi:outer membrane protein assembly factor BamB